MSNKFVLIQFKISNNTHKELLRNVCFQHPNNCKLKTLAIIKHIISPCYYLFLVFKQYLTNVPPDGRVWLKAFLGGFDAGPWPICVRRTPKMPQAPSAFP